MLAALQCSMVQYGILLVRIFLKNCPMQFFNLHINVLWEWKWCFFPLCAIVVLVSTAYKVSAVAAWSAVKIRVHFQEFPFQASCLNCKSHSYLYSHALSKDTLILSMPYQDWQGQVILENLLNYWAYWNIQSFVLALFTISYSVAVNKVHHISCYCLCKLFNTDH